MTPNQNPPTRSAPLGRSIRAGAWVVVTAVVLAGAVATFVWFSRQGDPRALYALAPSLLAGLVVTSVFTVANIALRWTRWHYLVRSLGVRLPTRESLAVYLAALPAMLTPFSIGELLRVVLLGKRYPRLRLDAVGIWIIERTTDVFVLAAIAGCVGRKAALAVGGLALWIAALLIVRTVCRQRHLGAGLKLTTLPVLLGLSVMSWVLPGLALWLAASLVGATLSAGAAMDSFAYSTLVGGSVGIPLGTGLTGTTLIHSLLNHGMETTPAVGLVFAFRSGTAWLALVIGCIAWGFFHVRLMALLCGTEGGDHFDEIADVYEEQIPDHVREHLLRRKVSLMADRLAPSASQRGLDLGCGQGWYITEMAKQGFTMSGVDLSAEQVSLARKHAAAAGVDVRLETAGGQRLPFPDDGFDFAYAINVIHHVTDPAVRNTLWHELVRVLKPGGIFFMHEINIANPLFRFYMSYLFPLIKTIDEGTEVWAHPARLPDVAGAHWETDIRYFTFLPDFTPAGLIFKLLRALEQKLERSRLRSWSAHYVARPVKDENPTPTAPETQESPGTDRSPPRETGPRV